MSPTTIAQRRAHGVGIRELPDRALSPAVCDLSPAALDRALASRLHIIGGMKTISNELLATATGGQMLRNYSQRNAALTSQLTTLQDSIKSVATASQTAQQQQQSQQSMMMMLMMMRR